MIDIQITVYLDMVFIINFIFDFIGIYLTGIVSDEPRRIIRFIGAASIYALVDVLYAVFDMNSNGITVLFIFIIIEFVGIFIGFGRVKLKKYILLMIVKK